MNLFIKIFILLLFQSLVLAQSCDKPFAINFVATGQDSLKVRWLSSSGQGILGYQLAYGTRNTPVNEAIKTDTFSQKDFVIKNLMPSTQYVLFLRTICSDTTNSGWNGPFSFTTLLSNPTLCGTEIALKDENCNSGGETFIIDVKEEGILGASIFLESIDFLLEHPWLADMEIIVENPAGSQAILSQFNGAAQNNFGVPNGKCDTLTRFSSNACIPISDGVAPFSGTYSPISSLVNLNDGSNSKGLWKIHFCDRSLDDKGFLRYLHFNLTPQLCEPIVDFYISDVEGTSVTINWTPPFNCESLTMEYGEKGFTQGVGMGVTKQVNCKKGTSIISNLDPLKEYDFYLFGDCITSVAAPSCKSSFITTCGDVLYQTNFDDLPLCQNSCAFECAISDVWTNTKNDDLDWLVWKGGTDTKNTGPESDVNRRGNYIYIESSPAICGTEQRGILTSECIHLSENTGCGMGFYHHMEGGDQGSLKLEISVDDALTWVELYKTSMSEGWQLNTIDLADYAGMSVLMRFVATTGLGVESDIAIDQIEFYGETSFGARPLYLDKDNDGYGIADSILIICGAIPQGYALESGDCNDDNPAINPGMSEIGCNSIDENCNGLDDDNKEPPTFDIALQNESCFGLKDGSLELSITGMNSPYSVKWNDGTFGTNKTNLGAGFYRATVTDISSCATVTPFYEIKAESKIEIELKSVLPSVCSGRRDGEITILPTGGVKPYSYEWNIDQIRATIIGLKEGDYHVTVTDQEGCIKEFGPIHIGVEKPLNVGTSFHKNVSCYGGNDGKVILSTTNGIAPFTYLWENGSTSTTLDSLSAGAYSVTVTDKISCIAAFTAEITEPDSLSQILLNIETIKCNGEQNGKIKTATVGGTPPYNYQWSSGHQSDDIFDLAAGKYALQVFDNNGCIGSLDTITLTEPLPLLLTIDSLKAATCRRSEDAAIYLSMTGGTLPYDYFWRRLDADSLVAESIFAGNYGFTGVDRNQCKASLPGIDIQYGNKPSQIELTALQPYICPNEYTAQIKVAIDNGAIPFNYNWSNGVIKNSTHLTDTLVNIGSGKYKVTITDGEGCVTQSTLLEFDVIEPFSHVISTYIPNVCSYDTSGIIGIQLLGGSPPYNLEWSNGKKTPAIGKLTNGTYSLSVTDKNECSYFINNVEMFSSSNLAITAEITNTTEEQMNGSIRILPNNGQPVYQISWDPDTLQGFTVENLDMGSYYATISDELGCFIDSTFIVDKTSSTTDSKESITVKIVPNPTSATFSVLSDHVLLSVSIYNMQGKFLTQTKSLQNIDISEFENGMYLLKLEGPDHRIHAIRIIKTD